MLVDRVWPRGLTKDAAHLDEWIKGVAPSTPLRRWYGHRSERFTEFRRRYLAELAEPQPAAAMNMIPPDAVYPWVSLIKSTAVTGGPRPAR